MLFQTTGLAFREGVSLAVRLEGAGQLFDRLEGLPALYPLGGERRLAEWRKGIVEGWTCPDEIANKTAKGKYLRLILATPAIFQHGWRPGWIGEDGKGTIPGTEIGVTLVAAAVDRWRAISGWSYEDRHSGKRQKPVRRLVPAGSVYFFEREGIDLAFPATERWLRPVCDAEQDGLDGFGLGLWGIWREHGEVSK
jgi:CRISPR-associated protein Cmr3